MGMIRSVSKHIADRAARFRLARRKKQEPAVSEAVKKEILTSVRESEDAILARMHREMEDQRKRIRGEIYQRLKGMLGPIEDQREMPPWPLVREVLYELAQWREMKRPATDRMGLPRWLYSKDAIANPEISLFGASSTDRKAAAARNPHLADKILAEGQDYATEDDAG